MYLLSHQPSLIPKIMESLAPTHLLLLLLFTLFTFIATISCTESISNPIQDDIHDIVCSVPGVNCAQGKCKYSNDSSHSIYVPGLGRVGFDCDCNPGWKKIQIGPFTYPSCLIPDCTVNVGCDLSPPQPPPFPPPLVIPQCALVWCGDGTCIANGPSGYICQCNEGTLNMLDNPQLACLKTCAFGGDCKKLGFASDGKSNAPSSQTIDNSTSVLNFSRNLYAVTMMLLTSIFLTWI